MRRIADKTERELRRHWYPTGERFATGGRVSIADAICSSARRMSVQLKPKFIVSFTLSGKTAHLMSKHRPFVPIIAMSPSETVLRRLSLYWGVHQVMIDMVENTEDLISAAERILVQKRLCREGDMVLIIGGVPVLAGEPTNMIKAHRVKIGGRNI
jgi:pyruvate kinase